MKLKRIELKGFKSFPDRTVISFIDGITCIVGPNGCGKSNIMDAVHWVLGEQKTTTLRAKKMADVIFSGTQHKSRLNYAHVQLIFDNGEKIDEKFKGELSIERYLYRDLESAYLINGKEVRLKDIRNLLMDTSIGVSGYSLIRQGDIENILSDTKFDRRIIFEEASGISFFTYKKEDAKRRLLKVKDNLLRITDIYNELSSFIIPLEKDAIKAEQYLKLKSEAEEFDLYFKYKDYEKYDLQAFTHKKEIDEINNRIKDIEKNKNINLEEKEELKSSHLGILKQLGAVKELLKLKLEKRNELSTKTKVYEERLSQKKQIRSSINNSNDISKQLDVIVKNKDDINLAIKKNSMEIKDLNQEFDDISKEINKFKDERSKLQNLINIINKDIDEKNKQIFSVNSKRKYDSNRIEEIISELNELRIEKDLIKKENNDISIHLEKVNEELSNNLKIKENTRDFLEKINLERLNIEKKANKNKEDLQLIKNKIISIEAEKSIIKNMQSKSTKENKIKSIFKGYKNVYSQIDLESKYAVAIDAAIEKELFSYCINDGIESILESNLDNDISFSILRTNLIKEIKKPNIDMEGFIAFADTVVKTNNKSIKKYLSKIIIASELKFALDIQKKYRFNIVTLNGDILDKDGFLEYKGKKQEKSSLLYLGARIKEIEKEEESLRKELLILENKYKVYKEELTRKEEESLVQKNKLEEISSYILEKKLLANEKTIHLQSINNNISSIDNRIKSFIDENKKLKSDISDNDLKIAILKEEIEDRNIELDNFNDQILKYNFENLVDKKSEINMGILRKEEELIYNNKKAEEIESNIALLKNKEKEEGQRLNELNDEINDIQTNIDKIREEYAKISNDIKEQDKVIFNYNNEKKSLDKDIFNIEEKIQNYNESYLMEKEKLNKNKIAFTGNDERKINISNDIWIKYEISIFDVKVRVENISDIPTRSQLKNINHQMLSLEPVNINAIEEFKSQSERYEFLKEQIEDLKNSEKDILKTLNTLEKKMREDFIKTFDEIKVNFQEIFSSLFRGGTGKIELEDEKDPLESDILIYASPPGKKLQHMNLLSGGEKALSAIALLFAVLKTKPAPFYVLDEIEAALDDINIERFGNFLKEFSDNSQFIIITHRKGTMEFAKALYGVSMEEKGVSKIMSIKLGEKN